MVILAFKHVEWFFCGEGNGTPLQYSCLENLMDGGAWAQHLYPSDIHQTPLWLKKCSICIEIHLKFPYIFQENFALPILLGLSIIGQNTYREPVVQELNKSLPA